MKGGFQELEIQTLEPATIISTKPVLVVQITKTQLNNNAADDKGLLALRQKYI